MDNSQRTAEFTLSSYGRIDILVNNAALVANIQKPWTEFTTEEWDRNLAVDLTGSPAMAEPCGVLAVIADTTPG